jgi:hypothetical protein
MNKKGSRQRTDWYIREYGDFVVFNLFFIVYERELV